MAETLPLFFGLKGHLKIGMDADITVFNPKTICANTTYLDPYQAATSVRYLLVDGETVIKAGVIRPKTFPGQFLRATPRKAKSE